MVQWLVLCAFTDKGVGSVPGLGSKVPQAVRCDQKNTNKQTTKKEFIHQKASKVLWHTWRNLMEIYVQKYRVLLQSKEKKDIPIGIWVKVLISHFMKEYIQMTEKHRVNCSISLVIRTRKLKTQYCCCLVAQSCPTLCDPMDYSARLPCLSPSTICPSSCPLY